MDDDGGCDSNHHDDMTSMMMAVYDNMNVNAMITIFFLRMAPPLFAKSLLVLCLASCVAAQQGISTKPSL